MAWQLQQFPSCCSISILSGFWGVDGHYEVDEEGYKRAMKAYEAAQARGDRWVVKPNMQNKFTADESILDSLQKFQAARGEDAKDTQGYLWANAVASLAVTTDMQENVAEALAKTGWIKLATFQTCHGDYNCTLWGFRVEPEVHVKVGKKAVKK